MKCKSNRLNIFILLLCLALPGYLSAATPPPPEQPAQYVVDLAKIINPGTEQNLNRMLKELEDKTTAQVVVLTINSLDGEPIEKFSLETAEKWKLGQKGKDNGVLITVALKDRKYRFEIGYGLESILPDSRVGTFGRKFLVPNFRRGDYSTGIFLAVATVANEIATKEGIKLTTLGEQKRVKPYIPTKRKKTTIWQILFILAFPIFFIVFVLVKLLGKKPRRGYSGGSFWGGGGFSGGGFGGGFGGGGGGGFGGGGCSGGW
jgi:uncharacterized protein